MRKKLFYPLMVIWLAVFGWSFWVFFNTPPEGDGFTRGMNRVTDFLSWQVVATLLALGVTVTGKVFARGSGLRWLSRIPAACAILLGLAVIAVIVIAIVSAP